MDVRYRHRKQYPFVAVLMMDTKFRTLDSYVGWVSESRLEKKNCVWTCIRRRRNMEMVIQMLIAGLWRDFQRNRRILFFDPR